MLGSDKQHMEYKSNYINIEVSSSNHKRNQVNSEMMEFRSSTRENQSLLRWYITDRWADLERIPKHLI